MTMRNDFLLTLLKEGAPVFLASGDARGSRLTLHVTSGSDIEQLKLRIRTVLSETSAKLRVSVRTHKLDRLAFPRSLEHWLRPFASEGVLYDPTMIAARAQELLNTARSCRATLGKIVDGIFFDAASRSMLVVVRGGNLIELQSKIASIAVVSTKWEGSIRVVSVLPRQTLVPIDARSAALLLRLSRFVRRWRSPGAIALAISAALAVPASAHTNAGRLDLERATLSTIVQPASEYGVLAKLSVFSDGARLGESDPFISVGLKTYFGDKQLFAQIRRNSQKRCETGRVNARGQCPEEELGQTGTGTGTGTVGAGSGASGPGS